MRAFFLPITLFAVLCTSLACKKSENPPADKKSPDKREAVAKSPTARSQAPVDISLPGDSAEGEKVYKRICVACHGADGRGNGGITAADFIKEADRLNQDNKILLNSIANGITKGSRVMPPQKGALSEKEMKDALSYIRKQFGAKK
jgi:mono/diheme cytochrome c family protein